MKKIIKYLNETIKKEKKIVVFTCLIFIMGLIAGSMFINLLNKIDKKTIIDNIVLYFKHVKLLNSNVFGIKAFTSNYINNFIQLTLIFVLGLSMIGIIVVIFILFFNGFTLGLTIGTIIYKYSFKGILGALLYVFPFMVLNILIYLFLSFYAVYTSNKFIKAFFKKDNLNFKTFLGKYLLSYIISVIFMLIICILDVYLTPILLKIFTYII